MSSMQARFPLLKMALLGLLLVFFALLSSCGMINFPGQPGTAPAPAPNEGTNTPLPATPTQMPGGATATAAVPPADATATEEVGVESRVPSQSPTPLPTKASTPTTAPAPTFNYEMQAGSPSYVPNIFRQELGCSWMGVGGQVFDTGGQPVTGLIVEVTGELDGRQVLELSISGGAPQYGLGGFEITLADQPIASQDSLALVLYNLQNEPQSEKIYFDTLNDCTHNLVIINFLESDFFQTRYYLPVMNNASP